MKHFNQPLLLSTLMSAVALTGCVSSSTPTPVRLAEINGTALPSLTLSNPAAAQKSASTRRAQQVGDTVAIRVAGASTGTKQRSTPLAVPAAVQTLAAAHTQDLSGDNAATRTFYATVTEVLPNGHLVVSREKLISSTQSMDLLRFTAAIDPHKLASDNVLPAAALASMRLESSQGELPATGLTRFFAAADEQ